MISLKSFPKTMKSFARAFSKASQFPKAESLVGFKGNVINISFSLRGGQSPPLNDLM